MAFLLDQFSTFLVMLLYGLLIGGVFNIYQYTLKKMKPIRIWIHISDVLMSLIMGLVGFVLLLYVNKGEFRFYVLLAIIMGFSLFYFFKRLFC